VFLCFLVSFDMVVFIRLSGVFDSCIFLLFMVCFYFKYDSGTT